MIEPKRRRWECFKCGDHVPKGRTICNNCLPKLAELWGWNKNSVVDGESRKK